MKKLPAEWEADSGYLVKDYDGWRTGFTTSEGITYQPQGFSVPIDKQEWDARMAISTVEPRKSQEEEMTPGEAAQRKWWELCSGPKSHITWELLPPVTQKAWYEIAQAAIQAAVKHQKSVELQ